MPSAATSLITLYNAKELLQDGQLRVPGGVGSHGPSWFLLTGPVARSFVLSEEKRRENPKKESYVRMTRKLPDGRTVTYDILDTPSKLPPKYWDRVVAVFATGQVWQFKDWPLSGPAEIFTKCLWLCACGLIARVATTSLTALHPTDRGFYLHFADEKPNPNIATWNVKAISVPCLRLFISRSFSLSLT